MVSTGVFSPWPQDYLWEGRRKVNTVHYTLRGEDRRGGKPKAHIGQESRRNGDSCTQQQPSWLQCFAERLCLLAAGCQTRAGIFPASSLPSGPQLRSQPLERQDRWQSGVPALPRWAPPPTARGACRAGRGYIACLHGNTTWFLSSPVHWTHISYASAVFVMAKFACFLWECLFNISSLMSQALSMIHKTSISHVLRDLEHVY